MVEISTPPPGSVSGALHYIPPNLCAFEPATKVAQGTETNTLVWIGGLFDTLLSVAYPSAIAQALPITWNTVLVSLGSAGLSWGVSSIADDANDLAKIVEYFRNKRPGGKIVIMGHSTGCQDCMEYVVGPDADKRPSVDGVILQAPVSDREALVHGLSESQYKDAVEAAERLVKEGHPEDALPNRLTSPAFGKIAITAKRWLDIASPPPDHAGADDYFSSDLPNERLAHSFGRISPKSPLLILYSGAEENVPPSIDTKSLVQRWSMIVKENDGHVDEVNGGVVPGATHNLNGIAPEIVHDLTNRVTSFIERLDRQEFNARA